MHYYRYYQLLEDDESLALNAGSTSETTPLKANELNETLRRLIQCVYDNNVSKDGKVCSLLNAMIAISALVGGCPQIGPKWADFCDPSSKISRRQKTVFLAKI
jgi:hypothetical protein